VLLLLRMHAIFYLITKIFSTQLLLYKVILSKLLNTQDDTGYTRNLLELRGHCKNYFFSITIIIVQIPY